MKSFWVVKLDPYTYAIDWVDKQMIDPKHHFFRIETNHSLHAPQQKLRKKKEKRSEMLCKSVKDKQNRTKSHVFLNSNEWILFYRVCVSVQCTDYIHISWYTIFFLLFSCILLINQTVKQRERERERERPLVKPEIVERSGPKVSDSGSKSPAERSLSGNLNTKSFFNDFTEYDLRLSLPPPLPFRLGPSIGAFRSISFISLSDLFLCSYFCCVCVSLFKCLLTSISHSHVLPYINKIHALTCLAIYNKQNKYNKCKVGLDIDYFVKIKNYYWNYYK